MCTRGSAILFGEEDCTKTAQSDDCSLKVSTKVSPSREKKDGERKDRDKEDRQHDEQASDFFEAEERIA
ncbi:hypothetical protein Vadar_009755 [Vaccinium darrowii]|uniref:Uncharacterized protein n=1 Tax=Vaccinium darrowii TaxID=229202 RepID=A0ACB7Y707_9ERIC|nr:hypothetical protein Vadar_009755 [Vaccinium darrowii]